MPVGSFGALLALNLERPSVSSALTPRGLAWREAIAGLTLMAVRRRYVVAALAASKQQPGRDSC